MSLTPAEEAQLISRAGGLLPVGGALATNPYAQTFDRRLTGSLYTPTSTTMALTGIYLPAGAVVTGITFVSGSTAEGTGSQLWYALYRQTTPGSPTAYTLMAQATSNAGAAAFGANTAFRMALTAAQTCPYTGLYLLAFCCTATQQPTLQCFVGSVNNNGNITGMTPALAVTADTALGATAPATLGAFTVITSSMYAFVD